MYAILSTLLEFIFGAPVARERTRLHSKPGKIKGNFSNWIVEKMFGYNSEYPATSS